MIRLLATTALIPAAAMADVPRVMTDIAPIHSLTAQVMGDLGTPDVLLPPGADPHDFALRPSDAERMGEASIVFWVGEGLTPWLAEPLETLAPSAVHISLLETEGWEKLDIREHDDHAHDEDHDDHAHDDDHDDHAHDEDHDEHAHDEDHDDHAHDDHDEDKHDDHAHDHAHDHGDFDPHGWLDPSVAQVWVAAIASELTEADPENAAIYAANAEATSAALDELEAQLAEKLVGLEGRGYVLPHDGYQYFEARFGLTAQAAIAGIDARNPGPAQIAEIREQMESANVVCVFSDTSISDRWATVITEGTDAKTLPIDGVGAGLELGPDLHAQLLARLATQFADCVGSGM